MLTLTLKYIVNHKVNNILNYLLQKDSKTDVSNLYSPLLG